MYTGYTLKLYNKFSINFVNTFKIVNTFKVVNTFKIIIYHFLKHSDEY